MDEKKILAKIDELDSYLEEINKIMPISLEEYKLSIKDKRACERLLQISIEVVLDICNIILSGLKLGLPSEEDEVFDKLAEKKIISKKIAIILKGMKGFRNVLVHKYGVVDDEIVFENLNRLNDFFDFKEEILKYLQSDKELKWDKGEREKVGERILRLKDGQIIELFNKAGVKLENISMQDAVLEIRKNGGESINLNILMSRVKSKEELLKLIKSK